MLKNQKALYPYLVFLMISVCLFSLISCGAKKTLTSDQDQASQNDTLTENTYRKVIIQNFEADQNLIKRHPNAAVLCKEATFQELLKIGTIPMIVKTVSASLQGNKYDHYQSPPCLPQRNATDTRPDKNRPRENDGTTQIN
ncbi:MAG: hypothetical protein M0C28_08860 [Candidatus Moduliflexus flocculans]|nr:hypothetical protein [Candidatus Moduliflexus flocculans]